MKNMVLLFLVVTMMSACDQTTQTYEEMYQTYDVEYVSDCLFYEDLVCEFE